MYYVLAMVDSLTKSRENGEVTDAYTPSGGSQPSTLAMIDLVLTRPPLGIRLDKDALAVVPSWSHNPADMLVDQPEYELTRVPLTSISLVTTRTIKVKPRSVPGATIERLPEY